MIISANSFSLDNPAHIASDIHVSALGFESRCLSLISKEAILAHEHLFLKFPTSDLFSYAENEVLANSTARPIFIDFPSSNFLSDLNTYLGNSDIKTVSIDISSMNRTMIAAVISSLARTTAKDKVTIIYVPAKYEKPVFDFSEIVAAGPVLPEFSGFDDESDLPGSVLMGLGFEYGVALGLINLIEPQNAICMYAEGHDTRYENSVKKANLEFRFPGTNASAIAYDLYNPALTYQYVSSTIRNLQPKYRVSLIPMGPKILSCLFTLASIDFFGKVTLWRVVRNPTARNSEEDGNAIALEIDTVRLASKAKLFAGLFSSA